MINFPTQHIATVARAPASQKAKRKIYATSPEQEKATHKAYKDRRLPQNRRKLVSCDQRIDRRVGNDRRKGRVSIVV